MKKLFSIKDTKIGFMTPWIHHNEATAIREFATIANMTEKNIVNENIEDKELWLVGSFDEKTGTIISDVRFLCKAIDMLKGDVNGTKNTVQNASEPTEN